MQKLAQRYRYSVVLLRELVRTDFKLRYQGSVLGYLWSLLRPLLVFLILYLVFAVFLPVGKGVPHYPVYLLLGIVLWNTFGEITSGSVAAIVAKGDLLRKINFPKYTIIIAVSLSALINLALNFVVIAIFMIFTKNSIGWDAFAIIPLIIELYVVSIGVAFFLSALYVKFRDVSYIWEVIMQAGFYMTPILYPLSRVPYHKAQEILMLNPLAQIIQDARYSLVTKQTDTIHTVFNGSDVVWLIPVGIVLLVLAGGAKYFRKHSARFAEDI